MSRDDASSRDESANMTGNQFVHHFISVRDKPVRKAVAHSYRHSKTALMWRNTDVTGMMCRVDLCSCLEQQTGVNKVSAVLLRGR